jgi:ornithine cyclodeaminase/alanine dehydrogenase-like protein (mu-crystallin family)
MSNDVHWLAAADVRRLLDPVALRTGLESAMAALSAGEADVPPRIGARAERGLLGAMPGYLQGVGLAAKLVSIFPGNVGVPSHQGLIALFDHETGRPLAVMDAEVITEARTAMTAAIAADLLARPDAAVLAIVGGGAQARAHVDAFAPIRAWEAVRVSNRTLAGAERVAAAAEAAGMGPATVVDHIAAAVGGADVVALCTHADRALIERSWVAPGTHVSSVGSMSELPVELAGAEVVVVEWRDAVAVPPPAGAAELQGLAPDQVVELGDLIAGRAVGRKRPDQVTVYKSTGHAVQDVAAARLVYDAALAAGTGTKLDL